jgi:polysaccharide deacetylase family protein (PEP-CTERM system associated)
MGKGAIVNALTIDVEDYFQVSALAPYIARSEWESRQCRVEPNVERILGLLDAHGTKATFFTLGWIGERYPALVRRIVDGGHELASHGYGHLRASDQTEAEFFEDIRRARTLLEDLSGQTVKGYRAPSFSIGRRNLWAFDCLERAGYRYSSSIYPIRHDHYRAFFRAQLAGERRRLLPPAAVRYLPLVAAAGKPGGRPTGRLLFPPLGNRSGATASAGHQCQDALPALSEPRPGRGSP